MYGGQPLTDGLEEAALRLPAHGALGLFDEAFSHIAADIARLTGGQIAVIALLEIDAQLAGDFILHLVQRARGLRHDGAAAAAAVGGSLLRVLLVRLIILVLIHRIQSSFLFDKGTARRTCGAQSEALPVLARHLVLGLLDEALDHVTADVTGLTGGQVAVVALLEVDADLV